MKRLLCTIIFLFTIGSAAKAQTSFQADTVTNFPYICQADSFSVTVSGLHGASNHILDSTAHFYRNDTLFLKIYYSWQAGWTVISPFQVKMQFPVPPFGTYKILSERFQNGQAIAYGTSHFGICTTISGQGEAATNELKIGLYPNPAETVLHLALPVNTRISGAQIMDLAGKTRLTPAFKAGSGQQVNIGKLPPGIYLLLLETDKGKTVRKFIKN